MDKTFVQEDQFSLRTANLSVKLSGILLHVSFVSLLVFFQHGTKAECIFSGHKDCHMTK